jgi:hypothetical protein
VSASTNRSRSKTPLLWPNIAAKETFDYIVAFALFGGDRPSSHPAALAERGGHLTTEP